MATPDSLALLQRVLSGEQNDREAVAQALTTHEDPRVRMIAQYMEQQAEAAEAAGQAEAEAPSSHEQPARADSEARRRARRKLRRLIDELEFAQTVGDTLAEALGACYLCWGEDPVCDNCAGAGAAGWSAPDRELFARHILPAVKRFNQARERQKPPERPLNTEPRQGDGQ